MMKQKLLLGERIIYIATRLFNIYDKMSGNSLEQKVYKILSDCISESGDVLEKYPLYLPFRDTNEDQLLGRNDAFQIIYDADINRLEHLYSLIAYLDDPTKDDGICMEIGYAYANSVPIVLLSSDIQYYRINQKFAYHSDPIIHRMVSEYIYAPEIPESKYKISSDCDNMELVAEEYKSRLKIAENNILRRLTAVIRKLYYKYESCVPSKIISELPHRKVCIDIMGGKYEWSRIIENKIVNELERSMITCYSTDRFATDNEDILLRGENDIKKLLASDILVVCADGTETDAGGAALIGMAKKYGKVIIIYYSAPCDIVEGESSCLRNLMIELSAHDVCKTYDEVVLTVKKYCEKY